MKKSYFEALYSEIDLWKEELKNFTADTIFIGGGTPSSVDPIYISKLMEKIYSNLEIKKDCEISIESNPNSLNLEKLKAYRNLGINRISIGAQSFSDRELKKLGRIHDKKMIYEAVENARDAAFENINLDLMMAIPDQSLKSFEYSLSEAVLLNVEHISCYSLIIEENTKFYRDIEAGRNLDLVDEDTERKMYAKLKKFLAEKGYRQYEISNFSKENFHCRHNLKYWSCEDYLGLGVSAHSKIGNKRFGNDFDIKKYIERISKNELPIFEKTELTKVDRINEAIILGLRLKRGVDIQKLNREFNLNFIEEFGKEIEKNIEDGLILIDHDFMRATDRGMDLLNQVELSFYRLN